VERQWTKIFKTEENMFREKMPQNVLIFIWRDIIAITNHVVTLHLEEG
jgi:hypothetical protein